MPYTPTLYRDLLLTAGCAIDLVNTGIAVEIITAIPVQIHLSNIDLEFLAQGNLHEGLIHQTIQMLIAQQLLHLTDLSSNAEWQDFTALTSDHRIARQRHGAVVRILGLHRGWIVVCNEKSIQKWLDNQNPVCPYISTLDLVRSHFIRPVTLPISVETVLSRLQNSRYKPSRDHPHFLWWQDHTKMIG